MKAVSAALTTVGCVAVGGALVVQGWPWAGALAMIVGLVAGSTAPGDKRGD